MDAISINEDDLQERSEQIKKIKAIFSSATRLFAWTGEEEDESNLAIELMEEIRS
jgi:hypothetical protein